MVTLKFSQLAVVFENSHNKMLDKNPEWPTVTLRNFTKSYPNTTTILIFFHLSLHSVFIDVVVVYAVFYSLLFHVLAYYQYFSRIHVFW